MIYLRTSVDGSLAMWNQINQIILFKERYDDLQEAVYRTLGMAFVATFGLRRSTPLTELANPGR